MSDSITLNNLSARYSANSTFERFERTEAANLNQNAQADETSLASGRRGLLPAAPARRGGVEQVVFVELSQRARETGEAREIGETREIGTAQAIRAANQPAQAGGEDGQKVATIPEGLDQGALVTSGKIPQGANRGALVQGRVSGAQLNRPSPVEPLDSSGVYEPDDTTRARIGTETVEEAIGEAEEANGPGNLNGAADPTAGGPVPEEGGATPLEANTRPAAPAGNEDENAVADRPGEGAATPAAGAPENEGPTSGRETEPAPRPLYRTPEEQRATIAYEQQQLANRTTEPNENRNAMELFIR